MLSRIIIVVYWRCSFKKNNGNAPVGQSSARNPNVDAGNSPAPRALPNGVHQQQTTNSTIFFLFFSYCCKHHHHHHHHIHTHTHTHRLLKLEFWQKEKTLLFPCRLSLVNMSKLRQESSGIWATFIICTEFCRNYEQTADC